MIHRMSLRLTDCIDYIEEMYEIYRPELSNDNFIRTGFSGLDNEIKGIPYGCITLISSKILHGKTSLALSIALHAALEQKITTVIVDSQKKDCNATMRLIAQFGKIPIQVLMMGGLVDDDWEKITHALDNLLGAPISIKDDKPGSTKELISELEATHSKNRIGLVVIDGWFDATDQAEIQNKHENSMRELYRFAVDSKIAVILTAQLNQILSRTESGIPSRRDVPFEISDLAETVLIPYSPVRNLLDEKKAEESGVAVYKRRNEPVFIPIEFDADIGLFYEEHGRALLKRIMAR